MRLPALSVAAVLALGVACAAPPRDQDPTRELTPTLIGLEGFEDPTYQPTFELTQLTPDRIETFNRGSLAVTEFAAVWLLRPLAKGWRWLTPEPVRRSIENLTYNLRVPSRLVGLLMQGELLESGEEAGHFLVNTTAGVLGLFDVASRWGIETFRQDVGLGFARWGVGKGSYLVVPLIGPSSLRDGVGLVFDTLLNPLFYVPGGTFAANVNAFTFHVDAFDAVRKSQREHLYLTVRALWATQRMAAVERFEISEAAFAASDPEPSLGALLAQLRDPEFLQRADEHEVEVPGTGRKLPWSVWLQEDAAPVVYLIPGIGAHRSSTLALVIAERLFEAGNTVAAVSSPFHPEFIANALSSSYPGFTPRDSEDVYAALARIDAELRREHNDRIGGAKLIGYSLGGMATLFLADAQARRGPDELLFERFVAINPPVDLMESGRSFEAAFGAPVAWPEEERERRIRELAMKAFLVAQHGVPEGRPLPFDRDESRFMIGLSGRLTLATTLDAVAKQGAPVLEPLGLPGRGSTLR